MIRLEPAETIGLRLGAPDAESAPSTEAVPVAVGLVIAGAPLAGNIRVADPAAVGFVIAGAPDAVLITSATPAAVGFVIAGVPAANSTRSAAPADVGFVIDGDPEAANMRSAMPAEVGFVIAGVPDAGRIRVADPVAVGLVIDGDPEANASAACPVTVTARQPISPVGFSTASQMLPVGGPSGSVKVIDVPSCDHAVTVIFVAPSSVCVVFSHTRGASCALPVDVGFDIDGDPLAVFIISAAPELVGFVIEGEPDAGKIRSATPVDVGLVIDGEPVAV